MQISREYDRIFMSERIRRRGKKVGRGATALTNSGKTVREILLFIFVKISYPIQPYCSCKYLCIKIKLVIFFFWLDELAYAKSCAHDRRAL